LEGAGRERAEARGVEVVGRERQQRRRAHREDDGSRTEGGQPGCSGHGSIDPFWTCCEGLRTPPRPVGPWGVDRWVFATSPRSSGGGCAGQRRPDESTDQAARRATAARRTGGKRLDDATRVHDPERIE